MNKHIKKIAVLGSGVMGSRIACHFANIGVDVILLDILPMQATDEQLKSPAFRNKIVQESLQAAVKQNPSPVYSQKVLKKITTGNFTDDLNKIAACDWVIEVVIENLDIKKQLFEKVDALRKPGTLITSNTSGIPIAEMSEGRSEDFQKHFCGTHFFNPPRYLRLLEIIPGPKTDPAVLQFLMDYGDRFLGKTTVLCKDTPAFIANRVGVFGMMAVLKTMEEMQFSIAQVEALTGPVYGRPKSATFRTADVVGIDTFVKVAQNTYAACPNDESRDIFQIPAYVNTLVENKWLGDKSGQGFFKKVKNATGQSEILTLDLQTLEYKPSEKAKFAALDAAKPIDNLKERIRVLHGAGDKASEFYNKLNALVFRYVSHRIPEIADELYKIDDAMRAGFGWDLGPFEIWDILGAERFAGFMQKNGTPAASWIQEMISNGCSTFYAVQNGKRMFYDVRTKTYQPIPGLDGF
ncbi:MAG TPA: 3-hydroxyacyl-CoA dehydrogenase family protein, partial [Chitinophagales bacterium]|nr:3-hydroxyacyl-CoA dehydrogenase family protein [Chitinophagales bacterium]